MPVQEYIISLSLKKFGSLKNNFISDYEKKNETYYQHLEITIKTLTRTVKLKKEIL